MKNLLLTLALLFAFCLTAAAQTNVALNGTATASASSVHSSPFPASAAIDGDRKGAHPGGGFWSDQTRDDDAGDYLDVFFGPGRVYALVRVDVVFPQNDFTNPVEPTSATPCNNYALADFDIQLWNGSAWQTVPGGAIRGNDRCVVSVSFPLTRSDRLRVKTITAREHFSRVAEVAAFTQH